MEQTQENHLLFSTQFCHSAWVQKSCTVKSALECCTCWPLPRNRCCVSYSKVPSLVPFLCVLLISTTQTKMVSFWKIPLDRWWCDLTINRQKLEQEAFTSCSKVSLWHSSKHCSLNRLKQQWNQISKGLSQYHVYVCGWMLGERGGIPCSCSYTL